MIDLVAGGHVELAGIRRVAAALAAVASGPPPPTAPAAARLWRRAGGLALAADVGAPGLIAWPGEGLVLVVPLADGDRIPALIAAAIAGLGLDPADGGCAAALAALVREVRGVGGACGRGGPFGGPQPATAPRRGTAA